LTCVIGLDAYPGESFQGLVTEVSPTVDPASRTMLVTISLDNPDGKLKSGMFAKVKIITERKENIVKIPATAVINRFGEDYVFTVENNVAKRQVIKQGILIDGVVEVQSGLRAGQEVVVRGQSLLEDGSRVNVVGKQNLL
jgi:RND family efflux transporter MFP subunit